MIERLKNKIITKELAKLDLISGICGTAICNRNGLIIISRIPRHIDDRKFGAMAATMFEAIGTAITSFEDKVVNLTVEYDEEQLVIFAVLPNPH
ncbi:MAG: roadblock/LC7 domain-containing protein [Promethearchaeota archaeon]